MVKTNSKKPKAESSLFPTAGAAPVAVLKPAPPSVLRELIEVHGVPRPVVNRMSARGAWAKLRECRERAERKAKQPTQEERRDELAMRIRLALREEIPDAAELFALVCEAMALLDAGAVRELAGAAGMELLNYRPTPEPLPRREAF